MSMRDQFEQLNNTYAGATEAGDAEAVSRLFTEDAMLLSPGDGPAVGREAIRQSNVKEFEEMGGGFRLMIETLEFHQMDDMACAVGTWKTEDERGNWMDLVQRQDDGSLLYHRVCWNVI